jgi:hypothetical protein
VSYWLSSTGLATQEVPCGTAACAAAAAAVAAAAEAAVVTVGLWDATSAPCLWQQQGWQAQQQLSVLLRLPLRLLPV